MRDGKLRRPRVHRKPRSRNQFLLARLFEVPVLENGQGRRTEVRDRVAGVKSGFLLKWTLTYGAFLFFRGRFFFCLAAFAALAAARI